MKPHKINELDNFICGWYFDDLSICDDLIRYHSTSKYRTEGLSSTGYDPKIKKSTDTPLLNDSGDILNRYVTYLDQVFSEYCLKYPVMNSYGNWGFVQNINIQHYAPGEGFYAWHTERTNEQEPMVSRHMVFMTYLNDVHDGGETEFFHQKLAVKPEKGLTIIWPVDWTFTHRGVPSTTQDKFITTGWTNYMKK